MWGRRTEFWRDFRVLWTVLMTTLRSGWPSVTIPTPWRRYWLVCGVPEVVRCDLCDFRLLVWLNLFLFLAGSVRCDVCAYRPFVRNNLMLHRMVEHERFSVSFHLECFPNKLSVCRHVSIKTSTITHLARLPEFFMFFAMDLLYACQRGACVPT